MIGPLPPKPGEEVSSSSVAKEFENRAKKMKDKIEGNDSKPEPKRESWMLELPPEKAKNFGLGPRQFNQKPKEKIKDRSSWTDTPEQRAKRERGEIPEEQNPSTSSEQDQDVLEYMASLKRDQEMEKISNKLKEKRGGESLMEMHSKKMKKDSKDKEQMERRPFDRDLDLQANRFDNAQKELMLKRARQLNDKFSSGAHKFL